MADIFSKEKRSEVMSLIRGKNTAPERQVFSFLRKEGIYFQKHYKKIPGSPDIALPSQKKAIFIDGDFWHGWKFEARKEKLPEYWRLKISRNMRRDRRNRAHLKRNGWAVLKIWEHDLKGKKRDKTLMEIAIFLKT